MSNEIQYIAIGDSITGGIMAQFLNGFAYRFHSYLKYKYYNVRYKNLGCSGIASYGLLRQLIKNSETRKAIHDADIITITIGGNNLLRCINSSYSFINRREADRYFEDFKRDWPQIIHYIRQELSSEAQIYVMTLYNPFPCSHRIHTLADYYIRLINEVIVDTILIQSYEYVVVDVYSYFQNREARDWTFFNNLIISDPHPNSEGHRHIFYAFKDAFNKNNFMS